MNISTEHILKCNQSEPLADASGRIVDLMNENRVPNEEKKSFSFCDLFMAHEFEIHDAIMRRTLKMS